MTTPEDTSPTARPPGEDAWLFPAADSPTPVARTEQQPPTYAPTARLGVAPQPLAPQQPERPLRVADRARRLTQALGLVAAGAVAGALVTGSVTGFGSDASASARAAAGGAFPGGSPGQQSQPGTAGQGAVPGQRGVPGQVFGGPAGSQGGLQGDPGGEQYVQGTVTAIAASTVTVRTSSGTASWTVEAGTQVMRDGAAASLSDIRVGDTVLAHVVPTSGATTGGVLERLLATSGTASRSST